MVSKRLRWNRRVGMRVMLMFLVLLSWFSRRLWVGAICLWFVWRQSPLLSLVGRKKFVLLLSLLVVLRGRVLVVGRRWRLVVIL